MLSNFIDTSLFKGDAFSEKGPYTAAVAAAGLGISFGLGLGLAILSDNHYDLGLFLILQSTFHFWEYTHVALFHSNDLTWHSFLIDHSPQFMAAVALTIVEYTIESFLFPSMKGNWFIVTLGFLVALVGQCIRSLAMYTAGKNFTHMIAEEKKDTHKLVTVGIYQYLRHPSYFGWFWWAIAMQFMLTNPITFIGAAYVSWNFFKDRIEYEEETLVKYFKQDYIRYRAQTPVGIPLIK